MLKDSRLTEAHDAKTAKTIANWCLGELQRLNSSGQLGWYQVKESLDNLISLASMVDSAQLSSTAAKDLLIEVITKNKDPHQLAADKKLLQVSDESELVMIIEQVLSENQKAANDVRNGEIKAIGFLVGQVMKASQGQANPSNCAKINKKTVRSIKI